MNAHGSQHNIQCTPQAFIYVMYIETILPISLGKYLRTSLIIGNLMRVRDTSVEWTWLGLE